MQEELLKPFYGVNQMEKSVQRIRYPPFEHSDMIPNEIPVIEVILESENKPPPAFKIGDEEEWFVEWRKVNEGDKKLKLIQGQVSQETFPFLMRTRNGWYIDPDPMHYKARKMIVPAVIILISTLFMRAVTPALSGINIISPLLDTLNYSIRIGELDYPLFLFVAFPIFISPMIFRMIANMRDIKRQNNLIKNPIDSPDIEIDRGENQIEISINKTPKNLEIIRGRLQVGIAVPERKMILESQGKKEGDQTIPGMSTALPARRIASGEELGTGVGESIPMNVADRRVMMLEPMRVLEPGKWVELSDREDEVKINLQGPDELWPGSIYSGLIAVHWELIIDFLKNDGTRMKWVRPIIMDDYHHKIEIKHLPVRSGRLELSNY
ncbi:MAG: hypothetical protein QGG22_00395 [Candidatus Thalassarchaeaceae archaeon]|nr:hypothetical protein [Candidatus Thalassarchaeaceae archaeon]